MLTKRQAELLQIMADGEEMVECGKEVWVGLERTNYQTAYFFHRNMFVSGDWGDDEYRAYEINEDGRDALRSYREGTK